MDVNDRRNKYTGSATAISKNKNLKIDVKFDITELELFCSYIVSENKSIHRGNLINIRNLFAIMDMDNYKNDTERLSRIEFINRGIDARINYNLTSSDMILSHINGGLGSYKPNTFRILNNSEIDWVNQTVSETLKYSLIYNDIDSGLALLTKFKSTEYINRGDIVKDIENWVNNLQVKFRRSKADTYNDMTFSLMGDRYIESMLETHRHLSAASNKLQFGSQALNLLTGGGVESSRVYTILGLPGEGKSATLIDMAIQIKRYNKNYVCKDPTKRPCVVLLIMENSIKETVQRIFSMCVGTDMVKYSENEILDLLKTQGNLHVTNDDPIDLIVKYKPNLSVDTSYLYTLTEDLEDEGYEVICMLQDYIKRIRSVDGMFNGDIRLQLGAIINEFKVFATLKDIPVITASQLNRSATQSIDNARIKNKADLVRLIGRSNVGESNLIIENSDWICLIAPEFDQNKQKFLGIQRVKSRYYIPGDTYCAYIPYVGNSIKLVEDLYSSVPVHKLTMVSDTPFSPNSPGGNAIKTNGIMEFSEFNDIKLPTDEKNNIFLNATGFVGKSINYEDLHSKGYKVPMILHKQDR